MALPELKTKILVIGNSNVGKSSLLLRYSNNTFDQNFISTIGIDFKIKKLEVDGRMVKAHVWDTAGQERFKTITTQYFRGAEGVFLVFDLTDKQSFLDLHSWIKNINEYTAKADFPCKTLIACNKVDLHLNRDVDFDVAEQFSDKYGAIDFVELSAKNGYAVEEAFNKLIFRVAREKIKLEEQSQPRKKSFMDRFTSFSMLNKKNRIQTDESLLLGELLEKNLPLLKVPVVTKEETVECRGVSSEWILMFYYHILKTYDTKDTFDLFTTRKAVESVLQMTKKFQCRLYDLIPVEYRSKPNGFLSHAWNDSFACVAKAGMRKQLDYCWLDILAINQNKGEEQTNEIKEMGNVVNAINNTILCIPLPYREISPLCRSWCIYELVHSHGKLDVYFPMSQIYSTDMMNILENCEKINCIEAKAFYDTDKKAIDKMLLERFGTLEEANNYVKKVLSTAVESIKTIDSIE